MNRAERERERERNSCQAVARLCSAGGFHKEINHLSGRATVRLLAEDVWSVRYSGLISPACFNDLRRDVLQATQGAQSMILRIDTALTMLAPRIPEGTYSGNKAPGVVVVREDQYEVWSAYARQMARLGVIRAVVLQRDLAQAHRLLDCFAGRVLVQWPAVH